VSCGLTIVGGVREALLACRLRRREIVRPRRQGLALLCGPSTSPLAPRMTPQQRRGYLYVLLSILTLVSFDLAMKIMLYVTGRLRPGQVVGTFLTLALCYFLWRGSRVAHIVLVTCAGLSIVYALVVASLPRTCRSASW
jgi:hypothetical protein